MEGRKGMKEERLGERRVELQIFINPLVGSLSRPHVPMQIKSNTHTHADYTYSNCATPTRPTVLCYAIGCLSVSLMVVCPDLTPSFPQSQEQDRALSLKSPRPICL